MKQARLAEWILRRTTTPERAEAEIGDLLELRPVKGGLWFWAAVLRLAARQGWRGLLAFLAAFYGAAWGQQALMMRTSGYNSPHPFPSVFPDPIWWLKFLPSYLDWTGTICLALFLYIGIRFGPGDKLVQGAAFLGATIWLVVFFWWQPIVFILACAVSICSGIWALTRKIWHGTLLSIAALALTYVCLVFGGYYLTFLYQKQIAGPLIGTAELHAHPSITWVAFALQIAAFLGFTRVCLLLHRWASVRMRESEPSSKVGDFWPNE